LGALKKFRFPSQDSYVTAASKGKKLDFSLLTLKILQAPDFRPRFCFVVKKKNGCAVFRNRCRRILRNVFFSEAKTLKKPLWVMAVVKMSESDANWQELRGAAICAISSLK
jgi:ribonuclease P protein component